MKWNQYHMDNTSRSITLYSIQRRRRLVIKCEYMQCWGWDECRKGTLNDAYEWINGCNTWYTPFTAVAAVAFCRASSILFQILFIQPNAHIHLALWYLNPTILLVNWCDDLPRIRHLIHIHTPMNALWCNSFLHCSSSSTLSHFHCELFCDFVIYGEFFCSAICVCC